MATGWVKSLQCKSKAVDDVVHSKHHYHRLITPSSSCRKSIQSVNNVVETRKPKSKKPKKSPPSPPETTGRKTKPPVSRKPDGIAEKPTTRARERDSTRHSRSADPYFPALTEMPEGHPSRNVVEIIFHTSWGPKPFSGRVEMVFKVQNLPRTVTRFEEFRERVKARVAEGGGDGKCEDHARCVADGNEVMRFHCLGPANGGAYDAGGGSWTFHGGKGAAICTFSGSGEAHENAGGRKGRRAMMVCRVIAGRVRKRTANDDSVLEGRVGCDSLSGENSELLVFDSRAVLPCFLIIYKP